MDIRRTVLLADANEEFRTLVRKIIDETEEFSVVGSVGDGTEALRLAREEAPDCHELSFEYRQSKGRRVVVDGGAEVIRTLHERGYKLGIVSNLIGEHEVPDWLEEDRLAPYFGSVVLSSVCHLRKPGAEIYHIAARELGVDLADCVSVADNIKRDIPGAKAAGIGCNIIFRSPEKKHPVEFTEETRPDAVIDTFPELLELLPPLK